MLYKKIDKRSLDSIPVGLDLFSTPFTQVAIEKTYEREYLTQGSPKITPHTFKVLTGSSFLAGQKTRLVTTWSMKKIPSGTVTPVNVLSEDNINVINGLGAGFIRDLKISSGGQSIYDGNNLYHYKVYLENLINFSEDVKRSSMNSFGWYEEGVGKTDRKNSEGWKERRDLFTDGKIVEFSAPLYADIFQQPNLLLSGMEFEVNVYPHETRFLVEVPEGFTGDVQLELLSIKLYVTFVDLHPGVALELEKRLAIEPAKYPLRRTEMKTQFYDVVHIESHNIAFSDFLPRQLFIGFVDKVAYDGQLKTDGTYLGTFDVRDIQIKAGNVEVPSVLWNMRLGGDDVLDKRYIRAFEHFHRTVGQSGSLLDCGINLKMFFDGYAIWAFNLTTSQEDDEGFDFIREGITMIHTYFNSPVKENGVTAVVMGVFDSLMYIDITRTIRSDLTV